MSPTGAGGSKDLTETDGVEVTSDIDYFDKINIDVKLEGESDYQSTEKGVKVIPITNSEKLGGDMMCELCPAPFTITLPINFLFCLYMLFVNQKKWP